MPALAGTSDMGYRTFLTFNFAGGPLWGSTVVTAGYLAGASYPRVEQAIGKDSALIVWASSSWVCSSGTCGRRQAERTRSEE